MSNEELGRNAAKQFREEFGLGENPIPSVARLIEVTTGVGVAQVNAPGSPGHGMTMAKDDKYLIAVGCTNHPMRLRSTLAHELGHLRLDTVDREVDHVDWEARTPPEIQADAFARHLLVPSPAVTAKTAGAPASLATLSDLVQTFGASPSMVAIQLRDGGHIDAKTSDSWRNYSSRSLATQFGWHTEYEALAAQSARPRAPQTLLARAIEGYRWGLLAPAAIARLEGNASQQAVVEALAADGIHRTTLPATSALPPTDSGEGLTAEELALLTDDAF